MKTLDGTVLGRALVYAVASIDALPEERRNRAIDADRNAMVGILNLMIPDAALRERLAMEVERVTGRLADLTDWSMRRE